MTQRLLRQHEVAAYLSVSLSTVQRMADRGDIPKPVKIGNVKRWDKNVLDRYLDEISGGTDGYDDPDVVLLRSRDG